MDDWDTRNSRKRWMQRVRGWRLRNTVWRVLKLMVLMLSVIAAFLWSMVLGVLPLDNAQADERDTSCVPSMVLPIRGGRILRHFDGPKEVWLAGHRGVDISASTDDDLLAPADGSISFVGNVGGKSVVSMVSQGMTLTFEPAQSELAVGSWVRQGQVFAVVQGQSEHCAQQCVHWGVKLPGRQYRNPESLIRPMHIRLLPRDGLTSMASETTKHQMACRS